MSDNKNDISIIDAIGSLRPFTEGDWQGYSGAEGDNPLIAEIGSFIFIIDEAGIQVDYVHDFDETDEDGEPILGSPWDERFLSLGTQCVSIAVFFEIFRLINSEGITMSDALDKLNFK